MTTERDELVKVLNNTPGHVWDAAYENEDPSGLVDAILDAGYRREHSQVFLFGSEITVTEAVQQAREMGYQLKFEVTPLPAKVLYEGSE